MITTTQRTLESKKGAEETLLTPRFYTTDFQEISQLDISSNIEEIKCIVEEFRTDYNRDHFIRDKEFLNTWDFFDSKTRNIFIEFLERSCTAEFSGFLLYKEISRNLKKVNPLLAEAFSYMSRDEARHAGFLNKAMSDFNVSLDLGFLTKTRKYTFFAPKFIFYSTYLSEKIGYWRYITIYRHLEKNPSFRVYPLFRFFESWCQDENRHGDFFAALLKSQTHLLNTYEARLWAKFFLLSVFATMYLNDQQRTDFYSTIGLNSRQFDRYVIKKTNQSSATLFPVILDVEHPKFFSLLEVCSEINFDLIKIEKEENSEFMKTIKKAPYIAKMIVTLLEIYFLPAIETKYIWTEQF
uniref:Probable magnesium-protoporphyrin IX monomethyl ester [oxidative] cyclase n=1 Tax=Mallomonas splendens TaxID=52552 RepID=A0A3G2QZB9_9STRA|nr:magnesium-protoporphyrun IX monomethy ester aerobic oxidative cyclase [Mallomonas splendens]AYO28488.1 magnesium-protoporphyrun IX monomethy ester aerobic oxidative cyclase [Mallomonas splendens]